MNDQETKPTVNPSSYPQLAEYYRALIAAEQTLVNNRMTWMMTFQGFLFAAYAVAMANDNDPKAKLALLIVIPITGILVAGVAILGLFAAHDAISQIKASATSSNLPVPWCLPFSKPQTSSLGRTVAYSLPGILILTWLIVCWLGPAWC